MTARLFVYGTLRRESDHGMARRLAREAAFVGQGRLRGKLISLGEYPGLVVTSDFDPWVGGDVYSLTHPDDTLAWLDAYEGCNPNHGQPHEFRRVEREVVLHSGARETAWVYVYSSSTVDEQVISRGAVQ